MNIFGIAMVKNEADVVDAMLLDARRWAYKIFVYDNGSTDGTWQKVQALADDVIVPWKSEDVPFHNELRADVFAEFRHLARPGDWWCYRLDADEFYVEDPREFLAAIPSRYSVAVKKSLDYLLTKEDVDEYDFCGDFIADQGKITYLSPHTFLESRFFRHRNGIIWDAQKRTYGGPVYPRPITVQHYQYRSPQQIQQRLETRHIYWQRKALRKGKITEADLDLSPLSPDAWREKCPPRTDCLLDTPENRARLQYRPGNYEHVFDSRLQYLRKRLIYLSGIRFFREYLYRRKKGAE
ncbi:glycosyltransferase family 2 protein [Spirochaeta africana]|uniref:Glycosyl transferase family 2 n=1 Tax=Spirochaeta africana (strain ATCC 700263 / DSM 8902 / Z-7692) TaxID=889378 RepID=H9UF67_SPIAZ|nr:glycosyltransferase family 2 protein [Spirochaeta africana]AFG36160.1 hypothetical protein Spiaf_0051 [Spirochaeta africana DSM 8902]